MLTSARTQFVKNYAISSLSTTFMNHLSAKLKLSSTINYCDCLNGALYDFLIRTRAFPRYTLLFFSPLFSFPLAQCANHFKVSASPSGNALVFDCHPCPGCGEFEPSLSGVEHLNRKCNVFLAEYNSYFTMEVFKGR